MTNITESFSDQDLEELRLRGVSLEEARSQLETFSRGVSPFHVLRPCTLGDGILQVGGSESKAFTLAFLQAQEAGRVTKFVPASGAASRMFKKLSEALNQNDFSDAEVEHFFSSLDHYPFYEDLHKAVEKTGMSLSEAIASEEYSLILKLLLFPEKMNYSGIPKGMIPFHRYDDEVRTPFEEHLVEALDYALGTSGKAPVHFTVPESFLKHIQNFLSESPHAQNCEISFSVQKPSTDTLAVETDNTPFRDSEGRLVFRPGGHGSLIENLEETQGDLVFIKNIDNVVPDRLKEDVNAYKKLIGGYLVTVQKRVFDILQSLDEENPNEEELLEMIHDAEDLFQISIESFPGKEKKEKLFHALNRPIRVCGMVKNLGEPGGGPFWVKDARGNESCQIVESAQVDMSNKEQKSIFESSTHFNPVDLVCGLKDFKGQPFSLKDFIDPQAAFISHKSKEGRDLKALERPGLWNGAMSYWLTLFVEVPASTFTPVKTVFDLLRDEHRA